MKHFKGKVIGWDVVNEAISDAGDDYLRDTPARRAIGDDYIVKAFEFAHAADPDAELYYNDYSNENPEKLKKTIRLIRELKDKGVRLDAIGMQCHFRLEDADAPDRLDKAIKAYADEGVKVMLTELDVDVLPRRGRGADADPYAKGLPADVADGAGPLLQADFRGRPQTPQGGDARHPVGDAGRGVLAERRLRGTPHQLPAALRPGPQAQAGRRGRTGRPGRALTGPAMTDKQERIPMRRTALGILTLLTLLAPTRVAAQDNGDGTYTNPPLHADYPDPDIIRVGDDFYFASTTFVNSPGLVLLHSKDLVNWETVGYVIDRLDGDRKYDMDGGTAYRGGVFAPSLRYHKGTFYVAVTPNGKPTRIYYADDVRGPWKHHVLDDSAFDPGLFFDDDGTPYIFTSGGWDGHVTLKTLSPELDKVVASKKLFYVKGIEGSKALKINGWYYLFNSLPARMALMCSRAKQLDGPWETIRVLDDASGGHQGAIVDLPDGGWYGFVMRDSGADRPRDQHLPHYLEGRVARVGRAGQPRPRAGEGQEADRGPVRDRAARLDRLRRAETAARLAVEPQPRRHALVPDRPARLPAPQGDGRAGLLERAELADPQGLGPDELRGRQAGHSATSSRATSPAWGCSASRS